MKVFVEVDELYPFYYLSDDEKYSMGLELTEEEVVFVKQTMLDFWKLQKMLAKSFNDLGLSYILKQYKSFDFSS